MSLRDRVQHPNLLDVCEAVLPIYNSASMDLAASDHLCADPHATLATRSRERALGVIWG
jgi:hypothetical protein